MSPLHYFGAFTKEAAGIMLLLMIDYACGNPPANPSIDEIAQQRAEDLRRNDSLIADARLKIVDGDLLLRTGTDYSSEQVKALSKSDKTYSHAGIAVKDSGKIFVYHIEPDFKYEHDKVRKEPLDSFLNPSKNSGFALARYEWLPGESELFLQYLDAQFRKQIPFDIRFDLATKDSMYCSEMIDNGLAFATGNRITIRRQRITDRKKYKLIRQYFKLNEKEIATRELILIDQLFLHPSCKLIQRYIFRQ